MGQNDTIGKIELNQVSVLSSRGPNYHNNIQLFPQQFENFRVNSHYKVLGEKQTVEWHFTGSDFNVTLCNSINTNVSIGSKEHFSYFSSVVVIV